eukprot:CAMPEP_0175908550 /NCGR_PEP_ID=MMETSP0108-20121206/6650_1 /TAXON_ID=195067 ORGANISM="Goniomonas pacifica, Strain CCMP1869" /NCGR_SAMPLE_ID=MMETSP0108 /ASSEMBLY_ACC=CAM_ASM_000204 /LENGTH=91 /DNA_ID=CAMNT_0017230597 /DNA_START=274 /DNA_END=549 /DNA_ORIENTATION=+
MTAAEPGASYQKGVRPAAHQTQAVAVHFPPADLQAVQRFYGVVRGIEGVVGHEHQHFGHPLLSCRGELGAGPTIRGTSLVLLAGERPRMHS